MHRFLRNSWTHDLLFVPATRSLRPSTSSNNIHKVPSSSGSSKIIISTQSYRHFCWFRESSSSSCKSSMELVVEGVVCCSVNYVPLTPISFLERAAKVYRDRASLVYGSLKYTWAQTHQRCLKLASALSLLGVSRGDVVATLSPNVPAMYELHFAVPMAGAVLCTLNARLNSPMVSVLLRHSEAKIIFVDYQLLEIVRGALHLLSKTNTKPPILILISNSNASKSDDSLSPSATTEYEYESFLETGHTGFDEGQ